ncbi:hypothetical protein MSAN_02508300 [Mycena sanguinolenta]|uniref:Uncharacterized protein n=1 Tax=Mycena sanguinolenta TaxID=230812 RepID=A0A8H6WU17_9AGAR|nr:hypothetical protein MSAN_02508300 [Mycena sanguinolenta]
MSDCGDEEDPIAADYAAAVDAQTGDGWEPARLPAQHIVESDESETLSETPPARERRKIAEDRFHKAPVVVKYPSDRAGEEISDQHSLSSEQRYSNALGKSSNIYTPFTSKMDWEFARWAKLRGSGSTAFTDLLKIDGVVEALGLSYRNSAELNTIIDEKLPGRPKFTRSEVVVSGEVFELYSRNIIECVRALFGDTEFAPYLFVVPERHYADQDKTIRLYHNMHTGKWWWSTQKAVEKDNPGATIIPILLSSDKTQLTMFGNKTAYPVYMTIGNIPKEIRRKPSRRAYILLAYLPTSRLGHIKNQAARRRSLANLFHACLSFITEPLREAGVTGISIASGDGKLRRGHPIVACYIGDYPEQLLVACVKTGSCPTGQTKHDDLGDGDLKCTLRNLSEILDALDTLDEGGTRYTQACTDAGIKPVVHPFWEKLPYTNIFLSITSDILHQLYQGIIKHLIQWLKESIGEAELDARCRRLPPNHNIRLFMKGISHLNRVTGREHDQISRFLLSLIIDVQLPGAFRLCALWRHFDVPFNAVPVFQRIKFTTSDPYAKRGTADSVVDSIHVQPQKVLQNGDIVPGRFDTALVNMGNGNKTGTEGYRIAQVRVVFTLPEHLAKTVFPPGIMPPKHLAYVEWFTAFKPQPEQHHLMYKVSRTLKNGDRLASIIPVGNIRRSIHLLPKFGPVAPSQWKSHMVLDQCSVFFANPWTDRHAYATLY